MFETCPLPWGEGGPASAGPGEGDLDFRSRLQDGGDSLREQEDQDAKLHGGHTSRIGNTLHGF
jgi:hypothetical protein